MPDGDVVSSTIQHRWRSTYSGLRGSATPEELAPRALKALTDTLRTNEGIPGLRAYADIVAARVAGDLTPAEARTKARFVARAQEQTPFALVVHKAVEQCLSVPVPAAAVLVPAMLTVAEAVCVTILDAELFERVRPALVGERFPDHDAYDRFVADCRALLAPALARIGDSLYREPSAVGLRAASMRRRTRRPSTTAILNTSIL